MNILVTGSSGFVGRWLVRYLVGIGENVIEYDLENGCDIFDNFKLNQKVRQSDLVIHLAANVGIPESEKEPFETYRVNTEGSARVFKACSNWNKKVIFISTIGVYNPMSPYSISKLAAELIGQAENTVNNLDLVIVRLCNPFGPEQPVCHVISGFLHKVKNGEELKIYGDGEQTKDFIHVFDVVRAIWTARKLPSGTEVEVGSGSPISIKDLVKVISFTFPDMEIKTSFVPNDRKINTSEVSINSEPLTKLGWTPQISLQEGLLNTYESL